MDTERTNDPRILAAIVLTAVVALEGCTTPCSGVEGDCIELTIQGCAHASYLEVRPMLDQTVSAEPLPAPELDHDMPLRVRIRPPQNPGVAKVNALQVYVYDAQEKVHCYGSAPLPAGWETSPQLAARATVRRVFKEFSTVQLSGAAHLERMVSADTNCDTHRDLWVASAQTNKVYSLVNTGKSDLAFNLSETDINRPVGLGVLNSIIGSCEGIAVAHHGAAPDWFDSISILTTAPNKTINRHSDLNLTMKYSTNPVDLTTADYNGDDKKDIVMITSGTSSQDPVIYRLSAPMFNGNGVFLAPAGLKNTKRYMQIKTGRFNGDTVDDVIISNRDAVELWHGSKMSRDIVKNPGEVTSQPHSYGLAADDLNQDGRGEIITGRGWIDPYMPMRAEVLSISANSVTPLEFSFRGQVPGSDYGATTVIAAGDWNRDGTKDLVVGLRKKFLNAPNGAPADAGVQDDGPPSMAAGQADKEKYYVAFYPIRLVPGSKGTSLDVQSPLYVKLDGDVGAIVLDDFNGDSHKEVAIAYGSDRVLFLTLHPDALSQ